MPPRTSKLWLRITVFVAVGLLFVVGRLLFPDSDQRFERKMFVLGLLALLLLGAALGQALKRRGEQDTE